MRTHTEKKEGQYFGSEGRKKKEKRGEDEKKCVNEGERSKEGRGKEKERNKEWGKLGGKGEK